jgi:hypothetical protein
MHVRKVLMCLCLIGAEQFLAPTGPISRAHASDAELSPHLPGSEIYIDQAHGRVLEKENLVPIRQT